MTDTTNRRDVLRFCLLAALTSASPRDVRAQSRTAPCRPTGADLPGPFYLSGSPDRIAIAAPDEPGDRLIIRGRILGADCKTPLAGALVDVWQADASGNYHGQDERYRLRGRLRTNGSGAYELFSIRPGRYRLDGRFRPAHVHFIITHPSAQPLTTQLYFKGDPYLAPNDACGPACHSDDPGRVIELRKEEILGAEMLSGAFDIVLKG